MKTIREGVGYEEEVGDQAQSSFPHKLPPSPKKRVVREVAGTNIVMSCPTNKKHEIVKWFKDSLKMSPSRLRKRTRGRIVIDKRHKIHIRSVRAKDEGKYDCYVDGYKKGEEVLGGRGTTVFNYNSISQFRISRSRPILTF